MVEVADDRRPAVRPRSRARSAPRSRSRSGRSSSPAARASARPSSPEPVDELDLEVVPGDGHRPGRRRGGDRHDRPDGARTRRARPRARPSRRASHRRRARARSMPERIEQSPLARGPGRASRSRERRARTADRSADPPTSARSSRSGRRAGSRTSTPTRSVSSARPGPMSGAHQSPAASADPVSAWTTRTCGASPGARAVVAVGDGQSGQRRAVVERERPERDRFEAAGPGRGTSRLDRAGLRHAAAPVARIPSVTRPRRRAPRRRGSRRSPPPTPARGRR